MNCKPNDLAIVVRVLEERNNHLLGRIVTVLHRAPGHDFALPNGHGHIGVPEAAAWVVEFSRPAKLPTILSFRDSRFGCCYDSQLRPIRGDSADETEDASADTPIPAEVA